MSNWFIVVFYLLFAYGLSVIITQSVGPFNVFFRLRLFASSISDNLGTLFKCMLCMPTNVGIVFSLINWFFIPMNITPFNMILEGTNLWWLAAIMDGCVTAAFCQFLWNLYDYIDKSTPIFETYEQTTDGTEE